VVDVPQPPSRYAAVLHSSVPPDGRTIRYIRNCHGDGRDRRPDVQEAIRTRIAMVLSGGYPERERRLAEKIRAEVLERAGGRCEQCGRVLDFDGSTGDQDAMATIQHVMGNSSDLSNLKAWCWRCNMDDAQNSLRLARCDRIG
jgi:5-methylcytosine-specific restriction endonuclease McrA